MSLPNSHFSGRSMAVLSKLRLRPNTILWSIIIGALVAFELFNYSTTDYALRDLLGNLKFGGVMWSTILAIAFCGIDFAGVARLFTPQDSSAEPKEAWYLFGAWMLAAVMNATLTWWGISIAMSTHTLQSAAVVDATTLTKVIPVFVAVMVWVIRILVIGTLSMTVNRMLGGQQAGETVARPRPISPMGGLEPSAPHVSPRPLARPPMVQQTRGVQPSRRPEPTYHTFNASRQTELRAPGKGPETPQSL